MLGSNTLQAWQMWKDERLIELLDTTLDTESHKLQMMRCVNIWFVVCPRECGRSTNHVRGCCNAK
jgi:hypothetical protein